MVKQQEAFSVFPRVLRAALVFFCAVLSSCASSPPEDSVASGEITQEAAEPETEPTVSEFGEIWAYLIDGNEEYLDYGYPLTDIGYFGAEIDTYGTLTGVPDRSKIGGFPGRVHLVVVCNSASLTHFCLEPDGNVRDGLVDSLVEAAEPFDGLQIDFELVPKRDIQTFFSFLAELRSRLADKVFSVALPARTRAIENDVYDYGRISAVVDRILVMAYDEHWSTSSPGPIASLDWCDRIAAHSLQAVGAEKLIMGLPFYGRTWGSVSLNRAFYFSGIQRIMRENNVADVRREEGIPAFTYEVPVTVTGYYEDVHSLSERLSRYKASGVRAVGFWCLGQEDPRIWDYVRVESD